MAGEDPVGPVREAVRAGGLLPAGGPLVVMLSGGQDSVCLLDVAVQVCGAGAVTALHVNYGLRAESDGDERHCRELCEHLGTAIEVTDAPAAGRPRGPDGAPAGNLHAWAREARYAAAERLAAALDAPIATGHTSSDQAETILYRLAASPGRRALLGMSAAEGRLVRPLLALTREQTAAYCRAVGLSWRNDSSNDDDRYARARVRNGLLAALRAVHPGAEANIVRTARLLREEAIVLDELLERELRDGAEVALSRLAELPRSLARLIVIRLAEDAAGTYVPQAGERLDEILALALRGGRAELHVGGNAGALLDRGVLRMVRLPPRPVRAAEPGECRPGAAPTAAEPGEHPAAHGLDS